MFSFVVAQDCAVLLFQEVSSALINQSYKDRCRVFCPTLFLLRKLGSQVKASVYLVRQKTLLDFGTCRTGLSIAALDEAAVLRLG